jgi:hypothetical protein
VLERPQLLPSTLIDCCKIHGDMQSSRGCQKYLVHVPCVSLMCRDWRSYLTLARLESSLDVERSIYPSEPPVDIHVTISASWLIRVGWKKGNRLFVAVLVPRGVSNLAVCSAGRDIVEAYPRSLEFAVQRTPRVFVLRSRIGSGALGQQLSSVHIVSRYSWVLRLLRPRSRDGRELETFCNKLHGSSCQALGVPRVLSCPALKMAPM